MTDDVEVHVAVGEKNVLAGRMLLQEDPDAMEPAFEHAEGERARALTKIRPARFG
jgi:hypothetical protein